MSASKISDPFNLGKLLVTPRPQRARAQPRFRRRDARPRKADLHYTTNQRLDGTSVEVLEGSSIGSMAASPAKRSKFESLPAPGLAGKAKLTQMMEDEAASGDVEEGVVGRYEYLDHTADIQLHAWGGNLAEAFSNVGVAMFGYMSKLEFVDVDPKCTTFIEVRGHDLDSLLHKYLEESLHLFSSNELIIKEIHISNLDTVDFVLTATMHGEKFNLDKHTQGTEVKAITYSAMQILKSKADDPKSDREKAEVYVIVDI